MSLDPLATSDEYEEWLDRLRSTYESVGFACMHRLGDRGLADRVSAQVVAGMISRPGVFRYFGLPYSARIGHLAEKRIAAARAGQVGPPASWPQILRDLRGLSDLQRQVLVLTFVRGRGVRDVAGDLGVSTEDAHALRDDVLRRMQDIAGEAAGEDVKELADE